MGLYEGHDQGTLNLLNSALGHQSDFGLDQIARVTLTIQYNNDRNRDEETIMNIIADPDMTMKELLDKYMYNAFGYEKEDAYFLYNSKMHYPSLLKDSF